MLKLVLNAKNYAMTGDLMGEVFLYYEVNRSFGLHTRRQCVEPISKLLGGVDRL
jgi:hypothetical protein